MKKITSLFIFFFALSLSAQQSINFQNLKFSELITQAKKENKLLFIDAYADWCGPCKLMEKNIFTKASVADYYNTSFVNARFDMEKGEGREIAAKYGVRSYPTYLFINGDGQLISQNMGYMAEEMFISLGKEANSPNNKKGSMKERFEKGENNPEFLMNAMKLHMNTDFDFAKKASEKYFVTRKKGELTKDEIGYLLYFIKSVEDPNYTLFRTRKDEIVKFLPVETYTQFDNEMKLQKVLQNSFDSAKKTVNEKYFLENAVPLVGQEEAEKTLNKALLAFHEQTANYPAYEKTAIAYYKNPELFENMELLKAAWIFSDYVTNKASLQKAKEWAEKSIMKGETVENTYILAKILLKIGDKDLAKSYAEMSKYIAQQSQKDFSLAEKLLQQIK
ncbi:MAG: thioredoxin fold domain-containing protein [Kaistella sp.]|nr:thioredoxin fold domain-containing protein [Kaistella sp.]